MAPRSSSSPQRPQLVSRAVLLCVSLMSFVLSAAVEQQFGGDHGGGAGRLGDVAMRRVESRQEVVVGDRARQVLEAGEADLDDAVEPGEARARRRDTRD